MEKLRLDEISVCRGGEIGNIMIDTSSVRISCSYLHRWVKVLSLLHGDDTRIRYWLKAVYLSRCPLTTGSPNRVPCWIITVPVEARMFSLFSMDWAFIAARAAICRTDPLPNVEHVRPHGKSSEQYDPQARPYMIKLDLAAAPWRRTDSSSKPPIDRAYPIST